MIKTMKFVIVSAVLLVLLTTAAIYGTLTLSLPSLSGTLGDAGVNHVTYLERDRLGTAIIIAENRLDATYAIGFAHGQDRFFQMDLLRRNAAGELSALFGEAALPIDENRRFHQFRKRSQRAFLRLPEAQKHLLQAYTQGVNDALSQLSVPSFEYLVTQTNPAPWKAEDSFLVIFSMYLDLQGGGLERDLLIEALYQSFGSDIAGFILQRSPFQAALDGSEFRLNPVPAPELPAKLRETASVIEIDKQIEVGSNNWAVSGTMTRNGKAMLSDDMHLGLSVPTTWYRTQINIQNDNLTRQITGVSLPGTPAIVVGSNGHVAWGFTNAYFDTADWYRLEAGENTLFETEIIPLKEGEHKYLLEKSQYGPVRVVNGVKYALTWVAHQDYAVNLDLLSLETAKTVQDALGVSKEAGVPVQNMVLADSDGNIGWQPTGAIPARQQPWARPEASSRFDPQWQHRATDVPFMVNPASSRLWTANSRAVSIQQDKRFGNGGYALGARAMQIKQRLMDNALFDIEDFYDIQLDNRAVFLERWHTLLLDVLGSDPVRFSQDIDALNQWGTCACSDSVGYTLVRKYRDAMIDALFAAIETTLAEQDLSLSLIERQIEPALWQLVEQRPMSWLPQGSPSWTAFLVDTYVAMRSGLMEDMTGHAEGPLQAINWGAVNTLKVQHPFSRQFPILGNLLDMPAVSGFGDRYMPAVQGRSSGASQRLIVQPGDEVNGILTVPGGQSGHPLSPFYREGFDLYANNASTPLLPGELTHQIIFLPRGQE